jgi:conjugal transfer pilus assembly protein TraU
MARILLLFILVPFFLEATEGKFVNPITDVCWECLFPITLSGVNVTPGHSEPVKSNKPICVCPGTPPKVGIPLTFWEPTRLVDVTRHAYKLIGMGGVSIGKESIKNRGSVNTIGDGPTQSSFYHVHWYAFPVFSLLELFPDFTCIEKGELDLAYMSEFDPLWNDDSLAALLNPEAALFGNPAAHLACAADCTAASLNKPLDKLFWCAGCEGSLYPLNGTVGHHVGAVQSSALLVHRMVAKMHRFLQQKGYDEDEFCVAKQCPSSRKVFIRLKWCIQNHKQRENAMHWEKAI